MEKLSIEDLKLFSNRQLKILRKTKNNLEFFARPYITARELKTIDKALTKIRLNKELQDGKDNQETKTK